MNVYQLGLIAKLCFHNVEHGPHFFQSMLEQTHITSLEFELVEKSISAEMLMEPDFISWFTRKINQWNVTLHPEIWDKHLVYYAPNSQTLLRKIYTTYPIIDDTRQIKLITRWNKFIFDFGVEPRAKKFLPNEIQNHVKKNTPMSEDHYVYDSPMPLLVTYLTWYAKFPFRRPLIKEISDLLKDGYNLLHILQFFHSFQTTDIDFIVFRDKVISGLDPIYLQLFFSQESCWWDASNDSCASCDESNWSYFLPQYRCTALCLDDKQCMRFAKPFFDFCFYHQEETKKEPKKFKRICKDNCPQSDKKTAYGKDPFSVAADVVLYPNTARAISDLPQYAPRLNWIKHEWYLPCVRYDALYYSGRDLEKDKTFCGKFFYYEPNSSIAIRLGKSFFCASKVQAWLRLKFLTQGPMPPWEPPLWADDFLILPSVEVCKFLIHGNFLQFGQYDCDIFNFPVMIDILDVLKTNCNLGEWKNYLDHWLTFHFCTLFTSLEDTFDCVDDICIPLFFPSIQPDATFSSTFFGQFDPLDQDICKMARKLQIETIVFQHEVGSHACVTEIMAVNPDFQTGQRILPKIWFPKDDGIYTADDQGHIQHVSLLHPESIFSYYESFPTRKQHGHGFMRDVIHEFQRQFPKRKEVVFHS